MRMGYAAGARDKVSTNKEREIREDIIINLMYKGVSYIFILTKMIKKTKITLFQSKALQIGYASTHYCFYCNKWNNNKEYASLI
jgi:hypothetical protein